MKRLVKDLEGADHVREPLAPHAVRGVEDQDDGTVGKRAVARKHGRDVLDGKVGRHGAGVRRDGFRIVKASVLDGKESIHGLEFLVVFWRIRRSEERRG